MDELRKKIISRVCALFNKYGIRTITMDEVASELGMSKKTLYELFDDKKDMIRQVLEWEMEERAKKFRALSEKKLNALEEVFEVNRIVMQLVREFNPAKHHDLKKYYPDLFEKMTTKQRGRTFQSMLANLKKGKKEGLYRKDLDEEVIAKLYISRMEVPMTSDFVSPEEFTSEKFLNQAFLYHIHGIANEKGIAVANEILKNKIR